MRPTWLSLCQTVAVSIATILGTGILGLPVTMYRSGLQPFLLVFTINFAAQLGAVTLCAELLQRAFVCPPSSSNSTSGTAKSPYTETLPTDPLERSNSLPPSLHSLASFYIPSPSLRFSYNFLVLAHFAFILCAYCLAAPQAYVALIPPLGTFPKYVQSSMFLLVTSSIVYFFASALIAPLSVAALVKAVLLIILVAITFVRGLSIRNPISTDWRFSTIIDPFLMSSMALNGIVNLMPVTFQTCVLSISNAVEPASVLVDRVFISAFRSATMIAVFICYILNILWCIAILFVVPQFAPSSAPSASSAAANGTLENANELGLISTIPLMQVLSKYHDKTNSILAALINLFTAVSITISFLIMSVGTLHFLNGSEANFQSLRNSSFKFLYSLPAKYWFTYAFILIVSLSNPTGLFKILEGVATLALNLEAGAFVVYMFYISRWVSRADCPPSGSLSPLHATVLITWLTIYFGVVCFIDTVIYIPSTMFGKR